jgi:dynein heavy chain
VRKECCEEVATVDYSLVSNLLNLFELSLLHYQVDISKLVENPLSIDMCFAYAYVWAFGGHLDQDSKFKFDAFARQVFHSIFDFPPEGLLFDYKIDPIRKVFIPWESQLEGLLVSKCTLCALNVVASS